MQALKKRRGDSCMSSSISLYLYLVCVSSISQYTQLGCGCGHSEHSRLEDPEQPCFFPLKICPSYPERYKFPGSIHYKSFLDHRFHSCVNTLWQTRHKLLCGSLRRMLFLLACMVVKYGVLDSCRQAESSLAHCLRFICIF